MGAPPLHLEGPVVSQGNDLNGQSQGKARCGSGIASTYSVGVILEEVLQEAGLELVVRGGRQSACVADEQTDRLHSIRGIPE